MKTYKIEGKLYAMVEGKLVPVQDAPKSIKKGDVIDYKAFSEKLSSFTGKDWIRETGFIDKKNPLDIEREFVTGLFEKFNVQYKGEPVKRQSIPYRLKIERLAKIQKERKVSVKTCQSQKKMALTQLNNRIKVSNNSFITSALEKAVTLAKDIL